MAHWERLSALDAHFLALEDDATHMHTGAVLVFDAGPLTIEGGGVDAERLRAFVGSRLGRVPRYRQRLARIPLEGHPVWVDDASFKLDFHVRHVSLPHPGDERALKRLVGLLISQKLDRGKPLWEMWVVEGLEGGRFALVVKTHHCMVDGIAGVEMLGALLHPSPEAGFEAAPPWRPRPAPGGAELLGAELLRRAGAPMAIAAATARAARRPRRALSSAWRAVSGMAEAFRPTLHPAAATPFNPMHIGPHRRFDWLRLDLAQAREVKQRLGGTLNDVVLATVAGAVGRFLRGRGAAPPRGEEFRAFLPVNVRHGSDHAVGNRVALLTARLPIGERDPRRRLRRVSETTRALKRSRQVAGAELIEEISDWTATALLTQTMRLSMRRRAFNLVVTNVPGPSSRLHLLGAPLLDAFPILHLYPNQALGIALFSYHDGLFWGVNSDWDRIPDLHDLVEGLAVEFEALTKAAGLVPASPS